MQYRNSTFHYFRVFPENGRTLCVGQWFHIILWSNSHTSLSTHLTPQIKQSEKKSLAPNHKIKISRRKVPFFITWLQTDIKCLDNILPQDSYTGKGKTWGLLYSTNQSMGWRLLDFIHIPQPKTGQEFLFWYNF